MRGRVWLQVLCGLYWLLWLPSASALEVAADADRIDLSAHLQLYRDPGGRLDIDGIEALQSAFVPAFGRDLGRGLEAGATFWLRLELLNPGKDTLLRWLVVGNPRLQSVQLFEKGEPVRQAGSAVAAIDKPVRAAVPVFPLHLRPGERRELLLRVHSETLLQMNVVLWEPQAFRLWSGERQLVVALALGFQLLSGVLSFFVFVLLREWSYFHFALLQLSTAVLLAIREGLLQLHLWPQHLPFPSALLLIFGGVAMCSALMFPIRVFDLKTRLSKLRTGLAMLIGLILIVMAVSLVDFPLAVRLLIPLMPLLMLAVLLTTVLMWRQGYRPARFMLLAFVLSLCIEGGRHLLSLGQLPGSFLTAWMIESAQLDRVFSWLMQPGAMDFSLPITQLISTPLILVALTERTRELAMDLAASRQMDQARSAFLTRVSHDLRSPLNVIIGYARMLARGSVRLSVEEGASGIEKSGLRVLGMIDDLLDQASLQSGRFRLHPRPVRLEGWLQDVERAARMQTAEAGNRLELELVGGAGLRVVIDDQRLHRVLDNLLVNANRHTDRGLIRLVCRARRLYPASAMQVELRFELTDTGCGIAEQDQARIFEPFVRLQETAGADERFRPGVGMGLPIAAELLRLMDSTLQLKSSPGVGSTFWFVLRCPLAPAAEEPAVVAAAGTPSPVVAMRPRSAPVILVVDDDADSRSALLELLRTQGFEVVQADCGVGAVRMLAAAEVRIDAVVTDQMMAQGDGWSVLGAVRERQLRLPVVLLSATDPARPADCSPQHHFDAVLRKPACTSRLLTVLDGLLTPVSPPVPELQRLRALLRGGEVSDIEDWIERIIELSPRFVPFALQVRQHLLRLDFSALEHQIASACKATEACETEPARAPDQPGMRR